MIFKCGNIYAWTGKEFVFHQLVKDTVKVLGKEQFSELTTIFLPTSESSEKDSVSMSIPVEVMNYLWDKQNKSNRKVEVLS